MSHMRPGSSVGLECQPVTLEVDSSSLFRVAILNDIIIKICGSGSGVEHRLAKAGVASSNLVFRSIFAQIAQ